jgi:hypothetical protein
MTEKPDIEATLVEKESEDPPIRDLRAAPRSSPLSALLSTSAWGQLAVEMMENAPQLQWPMSNWTYHAMRNDSHIDSLLSGIIMPALRMRWSLNANGADDNIVEKISKDYNIPIQGTPGDEYDENWDGFDFGAHLYHVLLALAYGHMYFDEWGTIQEDGLWHIEEMDPIMPQTIMEINIDARGKLESIRQTTSGLGSVMDPPPLTADRIVPYVWGKEGSNWVGRSMFRPLYRDWLIKDRVLRVGAINIERAGAGVPWHKRSRLGRTRVAQFLMGQSYASWEWRARSPMPSSMSTTLMSRWRVLSWPCSFSWGRRRQEAAPSA